MLPQQKKQCEFHFVNVATDLTSVVVAARVGGPGTTTDVKSVESASTEALLGLCTCAFISVNVASDFTSVVDTRRLVRVHDGRKVRRYIHENHLEGNTAILRLMRIRRM